MGGAAGFILYAMLIGAIGGAILRATRRPPQCPHCGCPRFTFDLIRPPGEKRPVAAGRRFACGFMSDLDDQPVGWCEVAQPKRVRV